MSTLPFAAHPPTNDDSAASSSPARALAVAMALGRIAIGTGLAAAPATAMRALGFRSASAETVLVARLAGGRDIVLGAATLLARDHPALLAGAGLAGAAVDAGDAAAFAAALNEGEELRPAALRGIAAAGPATAAGLWIAWRLRRDA